MLKKSDLLTEYEKFLSQLQNEEEKKLFQPFFAAVKAADEAMSLLSRRDQYGRIPLLNAVKKAELLRLYEALGIEAEALVANKEIPERRKDMVKKLAALGSVDYRTLHNYDPAKPRSVPELLDEARTLTVDIRSAELPLKDAMGDAQNKRQPLTFLDDKGREITGLFTPKKVADSWDLIDRILQYRVRNGDVPIHCRQYFNTFMKKLDTEEGARVLGLPKNADRKSKLEALYVRLLASRSEGREDEARKVIAELFSTPERTVTAEQLKGEINDRTATHLLAAVAQPGTQILNNNMIAKIHDRARMDSRNAAMSAVAELLNVPDLLAKSVPMKLIDRNGRQIEGTFMMEAKGVDINNIRNEDKDHDINSLKDLDGRALKSIADLQVLDFICGNIDRHAGNVAYIFDKGGKFVGVQGFDNDTAFGTLIPKMGDFVAHLTLPENMLGISETMYERICQLTPEMLKFTLRSFDLTEEELDAAVKRMQIIKEAAEKSKDFYAQLEKEQQEKERLEKEQALKEKKPEQPLREQGPEKKPEQSPREQSPEEKKPGGAPQEKVPEEKEPTKKTAPMIVADHLRVVKDKEWKKIPWKELGRKYRFQKYKNGKRIEQTNPGNLFTRAYNAVRKISSFYKEQKEAYKSLRSEIAIGSGNRALPSKAKSELDKATQLEQLLRDRTEKNRTSKEFEAMHDAVTNYRIFHEELQKRLKDAGKDVKDLDDMLRQKDEDIAMLQGSGENKEQIELLKQQKEENIARIMDSVITMDDLSEMQRLSMIMKSTAQKYLNKKGNREYKPYTQARIEAAHAVLDFAGDGLSDEEVDLAERNQRRAHEEIARRFGDVLEKEGWEPVPPKEKENGAEIRPM